MKTKGPVAAGSELTNRFCTSDCNNRRMVFKWGIYFETNSNWFDDSDRTWCNNDKLRSEALLLLDSALSSPSHKAPRCKKKIVGDQAPLRCSLARLAWEYCSCRWDGKECPVNCGNHSATTCARCPHEVQEFVEISPLNCRGDCVWHDKRCQPRPRKDHTEL